MSDIFPTFKTYEAYHKKGKKEKKTDNIKYGIFIDNYTEDKIMVKENTPFNKEEEAFLEGDKLHESLLKSLIISDSPIDDIRKIYTPSNDEKEFQNLDFTQFCFKKKGTSKLMKYTSNEKAYQMLQDLFCKYTLTEQQKDQYNTYEDKNDLTLNKNIPLITFTKYLTNTKNYLSLSSYSRSHKRNQFSSGQLSKTLFGNRFVSKTTKNTNNEENSYPLHINNKCDPKLPINLEKKFIKIGDVCKFQKDPYNFDHTTGLEFTFPTITCNGANSSQTSTKDNVSNPEINHNSYIPPLFYPSINVNDAFNENGVIKEGALLKGLASKGKENTNIQNDNINMQYAKSTKTTKFNDQMKPHKPLKSDVILCRESISPKNNHSFNDGMLEDHQNSSYSKYAPNNTYLMPKTNIIQNIDETIQRNDSSWVTDEDDEDFDEDEQEDDDGALLNSYLNRTQNCVFPPFRSHSYVSGISESNSSNSSSYSNGSVSTLIDTIWEEKEDEEKDNEYWPYRNNCYNTLTDQDEELPGGTLLNTILEESEEEDNNLRSSVLEASYHRRRFSEFAPRLSFFQPEQNEIAEEQYTNQNNDKGQLLNNLESSFLTELTYLEDINNKNIQIPTDFKANNNLIVNNNRENNGLLGSYLQDSPLHQTSAETTTYQSLLEHILRLCEPARILPFKNFISNIHKNLNFNPSSQLTINKKKNQRLKFVKIGEGSYAEVFALQILKQECNELHLDSVFKIVSFENSCDTQIYSEMLSEAIISRLIGNPPILLDDELNEFTTGFVREKNITCCKGKYPVELLKAWDAFKDQRSAQTCINDRPDFYDKDAIFLVFQQDFGGVSLEKFQFSNVRQIISVLVQVAVSLDISERRCKFEHRDLHWSNILIKEIDTDAKLIYLMPSNVDINSQNNDINRDNLQQIVNSQGVQTTIIDFTLSRLTTQDGCVHYRELSCEKDLFTGHAEQDYQYEVYRLMKRANKNDWKAFNPYTNVLWFHYLLDKILHNKCQKFGKSKQTKTCNEKQFIAALTLLHSQCLHKCKNSADICKLMNSLFPSKHFS